MAAPGKFEVRIGTVTYTLTTLDDEADARRVTGRADQLVRRILQSNPALNQNTALLLALVNAVDELMRLETESADLVARASASDARAAEARDEMLRMKARADAAAAEIARLRAPESRREGPRESAPLLPGLFSASTREVPADPPRPPADAPDAPPVDA